MANRKEASEPAPADYSWGVEIDGMRVPLRITSDAIFGIEQLTGRTLFQHAEAAANRAVPLADLAVILRMLAGPAASVAALRSPDTLDREMAGVVIQGMPVGSSLYRARMRQTGETAEEVIIRNGLIEVLAQVMFPIVAAMQRGVTKDGGRRPGYEAA